MMESKTQNTLTPELEQAKQLLIAVSDFTKMSGMTEIISNIEPLAVALLRGGRD